MRKALTIFVVVAAALWAAPAVAASSPTVDQAGWVKANTDLVVSQVAIAGPENVYSLEPIGPRLPTGEVLALVRTEAVSADWRAAHRFQSWDAHLLFDCQGGRVRVLRSASYLERDRQGPAKADERGDGWFTPEAETPAASLLAAACDAKFKWPLRESAATPTAQPAAPEIATPAIQTASLAAPVVVESKAPVHVAVASARRKAASPQPRLEQAASPDMPQFASSAADRQPTIQPIQKASFTRGVALRDYSSEPAQAVAAPKRDGFFATARATSRTCRRLAGAGRGWLVRRVEVVFRGRETAPRDSGLSRQVRLSQALPTG